MKKVNPVKISFLTSRYSKILAVAHLEFGVDLLISNVSNKPLATVRRLYNSFKHLFDGERDLVCWARKNNIKTISMQELDQEQIANEIRKNNIDILITYHAPILGPAIITSPTKAAINLHPSLLPSYRGGSPVLWQVVDGIKTSAVSVHRLTENTDQGEILQQYPFTIRNGSRKKDILNAIDTAGSIALVSVLSDIASNKEVKGIPQTRNSPTPYASNKKRQDLKNLINWFDTPGLKLYNLLSYLDGWPLELGEPNGWVRFFPLIADSYQNESVSEHLGLITHNGRWYFNSRLGAVLLAIDWSPVAILRHQRRRQLFHHGELNQGYL